MSMDKDRAARTVRLGLSIGWHVLISATGRLTTAPAMEGAESAHFKIGAQRRRAARATVASMLALSGVSVFVLPKTALAENSLPLDADGTLHIPALTMPPSDFVSPEFKKAYATHAAFVWSRALRDRPPMNAPKAEWDKYDADYDRNYAEPLLAWNLAHYPVNVVDTKMAGVRVGVISAKDGIALENQRRVLINVHGGGFIVGRGLVSGQVESVPVASIGRIKVITLDYRQAPYYKYPAASEDVEAVYRELLKQYKPEAIGIFGCSAGGILTAQAVTWFQAKGLPRPGAVGIFCAAPVPYGKRGDSSMWGVSGIPFGPQPGTPAEARVSGPTDYMEGVDVNDPKAFPGSSDSALAKFPPTLLLSGTRSGDLSAVAVAHARFLKLGVDSYLYIMEGGWHGSAVDSIGSPERHDVNVYIARWFDQHLAR